MNRMAISALLFHGSVMAGLSGCGGSPQVDWRTQADQRIEAIRKGGFTVTVTDADGRPLADTPVRFRQVRSAFLFGTAFTGNPDRDTPTERRYRQWILDHFNCIVHENDLKWYTVEKRRGVANYDRADAILDWGDAHELKVRGHCLFWAREKWVHDWVLEVARNEGPDALRAEVIDHIDRTVARYRGRLIAWDVANEILDGGWFEQQLGEGTQAMIFRRAHAIDPGTPLFLNEFDILGNDEKTDRYLALIGRLRSQGAPIGGIGIQEHSAQRFVTEDRPVAEADDNVIDETPRFRPDRPEAIYRTLSRLHEATGLPIHLTEISSRTDDPVQRANGLEALFRVAFSHPAVECIMLWGFWQNRHFAGENAALVDGQWRLTPAGERIEQLLLHEWRTDVTLTTDAAGQVSFRGFYGDYEASIAGVPAATGAVALTVDGASPTVRLTAP